MEKHSKAKNGADGQPGMSGTSASSGSNGQNAVSFTGFDENTIGMLLEQLNSLPGGHSINVINDDDKLQITLNGNTIVNINKAEVTAKLQQDPTQGG